MIRPLSRWKSLWFGLLVIAFLGWAWLRSATWGDAVCEPIRHRTCVLGQGSGAFYLVVYPGSSSAPPRPARGFSSYRRDPAGIWLRPAIAWNLDMGLQRYWIAHWFLILLFVVPWSGWLIWRWRALSLSPTANAVP